MQLLLILFIHIDGNDPILSRLQKLVVLLLSELILLKVVVVTQEVLASLDVFSILLHLLQLVLLGLDNGLQGEYLCVEARNGGVLLGALQAE